MIINSGAEDFKNEVYYQIGVMYFNNSQYDSAVHYLRLSLDKYPDFNLQGAVTLAVDAYYRIGSYSEAVLIFEKYAEPNNIKTPDILEKIAYSFFSLKKYDELIKLISTISLKNDARYYNFKFFEAYAYYMKQNYYRSITELKALSGVKNMSENLKNKI